MAPKVTRTALLAIALAIGAYVLVMRSIHREPPSTFYTDPALQREYVRLKGDLERTAREEGILAAQKRFKSMYESAKVKLSFHSVAHWLGSELYRGKGSQGIAWCDETAGYGCFHGFFGAAFKEAGTSTPELLESACKNAGDITVAVECIHGIGHGLVALYGYREDRLIPALDACEALPANRFLKDICMSGVYMEYNLRTMEGMEDAGFVVREFKAGRPYIPCDSLPPKYAPRCYYELPYWWIPATNADVDRMGMLCRDIETADYEEWCMRGIGHVVPWIFRYNAEKTAEGCGRLPREGTEPCLEEAAKRLAFRNNSDPTALCGYLDADPAEECAKNIKAFMCEIMERCN